MSSILHFAFCILKFAFCILFFKEFIMKLILKEDVSNLGKAGDAVEVARGYGRNFLIPQGKAIEATALHLRQVEEHKRLILKKKAKDLDQAQQRAEQMAALTLTIARKVAEGDKIFGSVTTKDIAEELQKADLPVDRKKILLDEPIRSLGTYEVPLKMHSEITTSLKIQVVEAQ
jgi:large subunit ribosomal protein L9